MAHLSEVVGAYSEQAALLAMIGNGYLVSKPSMTEPYDFKAVDPLSGAELKVQVKTIRQRHDRGGELVVYATNGSGKPYAKTDVDVFIGVWAVEGEAPRVYMFENRGIREYWATEARAVERWVELPLALNRDAYTTAAETA